MSATEGNTRLPYRFPDEKPWISALNYAAGLMDGEGTISLMVRDRNSFTVAVSIGNTDPRIVHFMYTNFGGGVDMYPNGKSGRKRVMFRWGLNGSQAIRFLRDIRHRLISKRTHADALVSAANKDGHLLVSELPRLGAQLKSLNSGSEILALTGDPQQWVRHRIPVARPAKQCRFCGKLFIPTCPSYFRVRKFCSRRCTTRHRWKMWAEVEVQSRAERNGGTEKLGAP